ncbi:MAG TPA: WGR domain-containing protein, partial [Umezawaea sp.]|nr:WGR domain-containing protein [Umezawaea sp.]
MRRWELVADGSAKFWEVERDGANVTVRYGRLGSVGQTKVKDFASDALAVAHVDKLVAEKEKKGYLARGAEAPIAAEAAVTAEEPKLESVGVAVVERALEGEEPAVDVPADMVPPLLVVPPWTVKRAAAKPIAVVGAEVQPGFAWAPGERVTWARSNCYGPSSGIGIDYTVED